MTLLAILVASFAGSLHCAAMCGGIVACANALPGAAAPGGAPRGGLRRAATYHTTRIASYVVLGMLAGFAGARIDAFASAAVGLANAAGIAMAVVLVVMALRLLRPRPASPLVRLRAPRGWFARALARRDLVGVATVGSLTALLPCGWLWSFVAVAAASADPLRGGAIMLVMGAGTIPALMLVTLGSAWLGRRVGRHAPKLTAALLLGLAAASLFGRLSVAPEPDDTAEERPRCH